jgi:hypothetical protein
MIRTLHGLVPTAKGTAADRTSQLQLSPHL